MQKLGAVVLFFVSTLAISSSFANNFDDKAPTANGACTKALIGPTEATPKKAAAKKVKTSTQAQTPARSAAYQRILAERGEAPLRQWTLEDFFSTDDATNLAVAHPFTVANAAEKTYAMLMHEAPRKALDPLYGIKQTTVYPMLTGHPLAGGRMVIGNEEALSGFVDFVGSLARGDRSGKAFGFPGPAGTGKTELLYVLDKIERNLGKEDKYKQYSYRWKDLHTIPALKNMFRFDRETGQPNYAWIDPDMPRSPFTLLREDMKEQVLEKVFPEIRKKWGMTITKGWSKPEPKSEAIIKAILENEFPEIASGMISAEDLTKEEYLGAISKYLAIVPKSTIQKKTEPQIIRAQTEDPNFEALFAKANLLRQAFYSGGEFKALGVDYNGQVFQQDGGLLMLDELYRNPESLLNILLEVKQNRMVQTDYGDPVEIDVVPVWNSNDESIEKAKEDQALKASIDRDQPNPMRLLLAPNQIEQTSLFQVEIKNFRERALSETAITPLNIKDVYPDVEASGKTQSAYGRYALYYQTEDTNILISPLTLNYMSWLAAATRFETNVEKMLKFKGELDMVARDPGLFGNAMTRLKIAIGDREVNSAEKGLLYKVSKLMEEGRNGISARDIETWFKGALNIAIREKRGVLTPRMMDQALEEALTSGEIKVPAGDIRATWQALRTLIKEDILLPRIEKDVRNIISGDGDKANRVYDEVEQEFIAIGQDKDATHVNPEDGSQPMVISQGRLNKIKEIYRARNGREFSPSFLFRNLQGARSGKPKRDAELLDAVREFLAEQDALTSDYISQFNAYYRGENSDPTMSEKVGLVESNLSKYGYDAASFREAVAFASQLRLAKMGRQAKPQQ